MFTWIRRIYDKTLALAEHPKAPWYLALISFVESSFFPILPDVLLLPLCLARREQAMRLALICTVASVLGGCFGYSIGYFLFDSVGSTILEFYGAIDHYEKVREWYASSGPLVVFVAGFTPIPYKVITVTAGVFHLNLFTFCLFSILSRGLRFGLEALIIKTYGEPALAFIDRHFNKLTVVGGLLFIGGFVALKFFLH